MKYQKIFMKRKHSNLQRMIFETGEKIAIQKNRSLAHDFFHIERVYKLAHRIAKNENANVKIVDAAAILHDVYRPENRSENHVEKSLILAEEILKNSDFSESDIKKTLNIIKEHSLLSSNQIPTSLESMCVFEADKIDGLGAIGIARIFQTSGQNGWSIEKTLNFFIKNYFMKYAHLNYEHTKTGRKIAIEKMKITLNFFRELIRELEIPEYIINDIQKVYKSITK